MKMFRITSFILTLLTGTGMGAISLIFIHNSILEIVTYTILITLTLSSVAAIEIYDLGKNAHNVMEKSLAWLIWPCHLRLGIAKRRANRRVFFLGLYSLIIDSPRKIYG